MDPLLSTSQFVATGVFATERLKPIVQCLAEADVPWQPALDLQDIRSHLLITACNASIRSTASSTDDQLTF